ncbi:MAG: ribonuclease R [Limisphaerales bacterium]|jgi:ribonuclease R
MAKKKKKKGGLKAMPLDRMILEYLGRKESPVAFKNIVRKLAGLANERTISDRISKLISDRRIVETPSQKLKIVKPHKEKVLLIGKVMMTRTGNAYVGVDGMDSDVFIPASRTNRAFDGDQVRIVLRQRKGKKKTEGEIVEIINRVKEQHIATIKIEKGYVTAIPLRAKGMRDIFIPKEELDKTERVRDGDRVMIKIVDWPRSSSNPIGKVTRVLGRPEENETEMQSIILSAGFPIEFPKEVLAETASFQSGVDPEEIKNRKDLREVTTITIDPVDARDFDDAISLRKLESGNWEVGVHIADVAFYVKPGSALDKEAAKRATSVYLVDRVNPMLPERLSNELCSLRPHEEKYTFSALFELDEKGEVVNEWFGRTVTLSDHRFTYEQAQEVIETGEGPFAKELKTLNELAGILRTARFNKGAINFDSEEVQFKLDENAKPIGIYIKERKESNLLVEDFMLLANKQVAKFLSIQKLNDKPVDGVYRVHDEPDREKLRSFEMQAKDFGYELKLPQKMEEIPAAINSFMKRIADEPESGILSRMAIRTMSKAIYTTDNIGHFGLGFDYYTHFTSPIRRYPDVLVHRILDLALTNASKRPRKAELEEHCKHASVMERKAMDAEFESKKYKQAEFLQDHIGAEFEGTISGITTWGIFVEIIENRCEGMIKLDSIGSEFVYNEKLSNIFAVDIDRKFRMGDKVKIRVEGVNLARREIDFSLIID